MKTAQIGEFTSIDRDVLEGGTFLTIKRFGEIVAMLDWKDALSLADQVASWELDYTYNLKDEEGLEVSDDIVLSSMN